MHKIIMLLLVLFSSLLCEDEYDGTYQLGDGIQVASLPLYIGGYISTDYQKTDTITRYRVDDVAMLAYGDYSKISYMLEFEFKEFYTLQDSLNKRTITKDERLHTEHLYIDYTLNDNFLFKFGKYNTPIGYWNLLPVNVLRATTSTPVSNTILYPTISTGSEISYSSYLGEGSELKIDVILQKNDDLDSTYNNYVTDEHYGIGLKYSIDDISFKIDAGLFHDILDEREKRYYFLLSNRYENDNFQLTTEIGSQFSTEDVDTRYAGYSQLVYHVTDKNTAILRLESYKEKLVKKSVIRNDNIAIFGYTYRPLYPIAIKSEYQVHSKSKKNKFLFSFSVMF